MSSMTDITELALMKGQKVEAPYYLAECTECGKMYPSSQLIESRNYMDGDADCYCPHCNATDPDIADCGSEGVTAWNYQQARIDALVEALEKAQQQMTESENRVRKQNRHICELFDDNTALRQRIAELESRTVKLPAPYAYLRENDGQIQISIGAERPSDRSGGYATPWFAIYTAAGIKVGGE